MGNIGKSPFVGEYVGKVIGDGGRGCIVGILGGGGLVGYLILVG